MHRDIEAQSRPLSPGEITYAERPNLVLPQPPHWPPLDIERFAYTPLGTFGRLSMPEFSCYTVERPWFNNVPRVSCIPIGIYRCHIGMYLRGRYETVELLDVPGRSLIKIHRANTADDVEGCIGLGLHLGYTNGLWSVVDSHRAFDDFWTHFIGLVEDEVDSQACWHGQISIRNSQVGGIVCRTEAPT